MGQECKGCALGASRLSPPRQVPGPAPLVASTVSCPKPEAEADIGEVQAFGTHPALLSSKTWNTRSEVGIMRTRKLAGLLALCGLLAVGTPEAWAKKGGKG